MKAEIFRHGINWFIEFYNEDGDHIVGRRIEGDINGKLFFQPFSH